MKYKNLVYSRDVAKISVIIDFSCKGFLLFESSSLLLSIMVVYQVSTASLGLLGHQAVTAVMAVKEPKVTRVAQGRLDPRDLQVPKELLVSMERLALKENLAPRVLPAKMGSAERVESLGLLVRCHIITGKSVLGQAVKARTTV